MKKTLDAVWKKTDFLFVSVEDCQKRGKTERKRRKRKERKKRENNKNKGNREDVEK